ncbi:calpain-A-like, partial [Elysia marginata]
MSFQDFTGNFQKLEICNLGPDSLDEEDLSNKKKWECHKENGQWVKRVNAGGCRNYLDSFWTNPQFRMTLTDPDEDDDDNMCTALVAVLQKDRRKKRKEGLDLLTIGYVIYKENERSGRMQVVGGRQEMENLGEIDEDTRFEEEAAPDAGGKKREQPEMTEAELKVEEVLKQSFKKVSGEDMEIDAFELRAVINSVFAGDFSFEGFGLDTARSMVAMHD